MADVDLVDLVYFSFVEPLHFLECQGSGVLILGQNLIADRDVLDRFFALDGFSYLKIKKVLLFLAKQQDFLVTHSINFYSQILHSMCLSFFFTPGRNLSSSNFLAFSFCSIIAFPDLTSIPII